MSMCSFYGCTFSASPGRDDGRCAVHRGRPNPVPQLDERRQAGGRKSQAHKAGRSYVDDTPVLPWMPRKQDVACCMAQLDREGRPPIGFCGPACERRQARDARLAAVT